MIRARLVGLLLGLLAGLGAAGPASARTITLTAADCDRVAAIAADAPRASWASVPLGDGIVDAAFLTRFRRDMALLLRFPLGRIPPGQRVVKAELVVRATYLDGAPTLAVRRLRADWGVGVCHAYRRTHPDRAAWARPGGTGAEDRAARPTAAARVTAKGDYALDVTEDVELWSTGGAANHGWSLSIEGGHELSAPPVYAAWGEGPELWRLRITYEPR